MASRAEIPASLLAPDTEDCLRAVSLAVLKVRADRNFSREKLAKAIGCGKDAIDTASNEQNMLSFASIALLCHHFPDEAAPILELLGRAPESPTTADRVARIERELAAIKRSAQ